MARTWTLISAPSAGPFVWSDFEFNARKYRGDDLEALQTLGKGVPQFRAIPRLPAVTRDLSLVVSEAVGAGKVGEVLEQAGGTLCESIELLGLFRGGSLPNGQKSLTFRVICRDPKARTLAEEARTLTDKEVDEVQARMLKAAQTEFGATLRG